MAALTCCAGVAGDFSCRLQPLQLGFCSQALLGERPQLTSLSRKAITSLGSLKEYAAAVGFACSARGTEVQTRNRGLGLQHNWGEHSECLQGLQQQNHRF